MNEVEIAMIILLVAASIFVGIIAAMASVIQGVLNQLDYRVYTRVMQGIIVTGRKSPIIWSLLLIPVASACFILYSMRNNTASPAFMWLVIGIILFIMGPILVSRFGNEPWYDKIISWSLEEPIPYWKSERMHWFRLNIARFTIGLFACFAFAFSLTTYH